MLGERAVFTRDAPRPLLETDLSSIIAFSTIEEFRAFDLSTAQPYESFDHVSREP